MLHKKIILHAHAASFYHCVAFYGGREGVVIFYELPPPHFPRVSLDIGERSVRSIIDLVSRASDHFIQFHF